MHATIAAFKDTGPSESFPVPCRANPSLGQGHRVQLASHRPYSIFIHANDTIGTHPVRYSRRWPWRERASDHLGPHGSAPGRRSRRRSSSPKPETAVSSSVAYRRHHRLHPGGLVHRPCDWNTAHRPRSLRPIPATKAKMTCSSKVCVRVATNKIF